MKLLQRPLLDVDLSLQPGVLVGQRLKLRPQHLKRRQLGPDRLLLQPTVLQLSLQQISSRGEAVHGGRELTLEQARGGRPFLNPYRFRGNYF